MARIQTILLVWACMLFCIEPTAKFASSSGTDLHSSSNPASHRISKGQTGAAHKRLSRHGSYATLSSSGRKRSRSLPSTGDDETHLVDIPSKFVLSGEGSSQLLRSLTRSRRILDACGEAFVPGFRITEATGKDGVQIYKISRLDGTKGVVFAKGDKVDLTELEIVAKPALQVGCLT